MALSSILKSFVSSDNNPFNKKKLGFAQDPTSFDEPVDDPELDDEEVDDPLPQINRSTSFSDTYQRLANQPSGPRATEYAEFAKNTPRREDYKPTKLGRLGAILSGVAEGVNNPGRGTALTRSMLDEPYQKAIQDYQVKEHGLKAAADLEEKDMGRNVALAKTITTDIYNQNLEEQRKKELRFKFDKLKVDERNSIRTATRMGMKLIEDKTTGKSYFSIPQFDADGTTPTDTLRLDVGKTDESISEGTLRKIKEFASQQKEIGKRQQGLESSRAGHAVELEKERQKGDVETAKKKAETDLELADKKGEITKDINKDKSENKEKTPSALHRERLNAIEEITANPKNVKFIEDNGFKVDDFITKTPSGAITGLKKPDTWMNDAKAMKVYKALVAAIGEEK